METKLSKSTDKQTETKLQPRAAGPPHIICRQQHTLIMQENGVPNRMCIDITARAPFNNTDVTVDGAWYAIKSEEAIVITEYQALEKNLEITNGVTPWVYFYFVTPDANDE